MFWGTIVFVLSISENISNYMGTSENFYRELGIKVETGEKLNISFKGVFKKHLWQ